MKLHVTISRQHKVLCRLTMLIGALALFLVAPCHSQEVVESFLPALLYPRKYRAQNARESVTTARCNLEFLPSKTCPHLSSIDPRHAP